jgi:hypothetical protein
MVGSLKCHSPWFSPLTVPPFSTWELIPNILFEPIHYSGVCVCSEHWLSWSAWTMTSEWFSEGTFWTKSIKESGRDRHTSTPLFKWTVSQDFLLLVFFHESFSPQPQSIPLGPFQICSKICGDIRKSRSTTVSTTPVANFATSSASVVDTGGKQREQLSDCWQLKMNLKLNIYLYANSTTQRGPKELMKIFLI